MLKMKSSNDKIGKSPNQNLENTILKSNINIWRINL